MSSDQVLWGRGEEEGRRRQEKERRKEKGERRKEEGGRRREKEERGRRKEEGERGKMKEEGERRKEEGGRRREKEGRGRRKEEGGRRREKEERGRRKEEGSRKGAALRKRWRRRGFAKTVVVGNFAGETMAAFRFPQFPGKLFPQNDDFLLTNKSDERRYGMPKAANLIFYEMFFFEGWA